MLQCGRDLACGWAWGQIREANPSVARWEPPDVVLEDTLALVSPKTNGVSDGILTYQ